MNVITDDRDRTFNFCVDEVSFCNNADEKCEKIVLKDYSHDCVLEFFLNAESDRIRLRLLMNFMGIDEGEFYTTQFLGRTFGIKLSLHDGGACCREMTQEEMEAWRRTQKYLKEEIKRLEEAK